MTRSSVPTGGVHDVTGSRHSKIARRVAAVAGAVGAAAAGESGVEAAGITYTPTAGVVQAQGIPGFSFTPPTSVTSGTLRPTATGTTNWDVDGNGQGDFALLKYPGLPIAFFQPLAPYAANPNQLLENSVPKLLNLASGVPVGPAAVTWRTSGQGMTYNKNVDQPLFTLDQVGYFGFRFAFNNTPTNYYYGWASLTIDPSVTSVIGEGYMIGEAFYQSTPNTPINVGAVPLGGPAPVPELPGNLSAIALLAAGLFCLDARARGNRPAAEAS